MTAAPRIAMAPTLLLAALLLTAGIAAAAGVDPQGMAAAETVAGTGELRQTASLVTAIGKAVGALAVVIGLLLLLVFLLKKLGLGGQGQTGRGGLIRVLETRMIAPKKYVAVLEVAGEPLVVGVTDQQVNLLARLDNNEAIAARLAESGSGGRTAPFAALLDRATSRQKKSPPEGDGDG